MPGKPPRTIHDQISLLQSRNMKFKDISKAPHVLNNISYYRLKGYWWEMQDDLKNHHFYPDSYFDDVIDLYNFDRNFRLFVFNGIERIEIALRTRLIYHLSLSYGEDWYLNQSLFSDKSRHADFLSKINKEMRDSREEFMIKHYENHPEDAPEAWKALEVVTLGVLSKIYGNLRSQLPEKSQIANEFGLSSPKIFASWLRAITVIRNVIAHHGRLWNRTLITGYYWPENLSEVLLNYIPDQNRRKKIFPILSGILYLNDKISPNHSLKPELLDLIYRFPKTPLYKIGFPPYWFNQPLFINGL